jgi:hypothetical protein
VAEEQTNWHHLFGLMVQDFFRGTPCEVELERDLSVKSQFLDVLILHKTAAILDRVLPDGLQGHLVEHNLITFKSHQDTLNKLALDELLGHGVNYRKQVSPSFDDLLPEERFRLFAVCARFPEGLDERKPLTLVQEGVYEVEWGLTPIRIVVAGRLPEREPKALLHLFSASKPLLQYGREHCPVHSPETSTLVLELFADYRVEGLTVPVDREAFLKKAKKRIVQESTVEERLEGLTLEQILASLAPEQIIQGLSPTDREKLRRLLEEPPAS